MHAMIYLTEGEHANDYTTDVVEFNIQFLMYFGYYKLVLHQLNMSLITYRSLHTYLYEYLVYLGPMVLCKN
jgi:hypothetical protein